MRSIERRFKRDVLENPYLSTLACFNKAIYGQRFSKDRIKRSFNLLVDKNDYQKEDKGKLLKYAYTISQSGL